MGDTIHNLIPCIPDSCALCQQTSWGSFLTMVPLPDMFTGNHAHIYWKPCPYLLKTQNAPQNLTTCSQLVWLTWSCVGRICIG